jgi:FkbM family methyltransferase
LKKTPEELKAVHKEPTPYKIAKYLQRARVRGGHRLENILRDKGDLDVSVRYRLSNSVEIDIPIGERSYDLYDVSHYESDSVKRIVPIISSYNSDFCFLDCGADIGLMSAKFVSASSNIKKVISFEPNQISYLYLERNLKLLNIEAKAFNMGVSNFKGMAELQAPDFDSHDHAAYVVPNDKGDFEVTTIDDIGLNHDKSIFLKIDVEGAELSVIQGALSTLAAAENVIILFEAHPKQVRRTGIDPAKIIELVNSIKSCEVMIMEAPEQKIDLKCPFFDQFSEKVYNICMYSKR